MSEAAAKQKAMVKKLEVLRKIKDRFVNSEKWQYAPDGDVEFNFMKHFYLELGAETTDILRVRQNAAGVLNTPISEAEWKISELLSGARFTAMELARLEAYSLLDDKGMLIQEIHLLMRVCMVGAATPIEA